MYNKGKRYLSHGKHYIYAINIKKAELRSDLEFSLFHALSYCFAPRFISVAA